MESYCKIPLSGKLGRGKFTKVSPEDYSNLIKYTWYLSPTGYVYRTKNIKIDNRWTTRTQRMHREILKVTDPKILIDHINHDMQDNTRENIRIATASENCRNRKTLSYRLHTYKGIRFSNVNNKWRASIVINYKTINGGSFDSEVAAAIRYDQLARQYHGEFAELNFPSINNYDAIDQFLIRNNFYKKHSSHFRGVVWNKTAKKWQVRICYVQNKEKIVKYLGLYDNELEAARIYDQELRKVYFLTKRKIPAFNFPNENTDLIPTIDPQAKRGCPCVAYIKKESRWVAYDIRKHRLGTFKTQEEAENKMKEYILNHG